MKGVSQTILLTLLDYYLQLAKMLICSPEFGCSNEIMSLTAMLSGELAFATHPPRWSLIPLLPLWSSTECVCSTQQRQEGGGHGEGSIHPPRRRPLDYAERVPRFQV